MAGLIFILCIVALIIYCLYEVHSKIVFNLYEPFCPSCNKIFDPEYTYHIDCPYCHSTIIWRRKFPMDVFKKLKEYREKRGRTK